MKKGGKDLFQVYTYFMMASLSRFSCASLAMLPVLELDGSSKLSTEWLLSEVSKDGVVLLLLLAVAVVVVVLFGDVVALDDELDDGDDKLDESVDEFCSLDEV